MANSKVNVQIIKQLDRFAKIKQIYASVADGTNFWTLVDNTGNEAYENKIMGSDMTALDTALNTANVGGRCTAWFNSHNTYFNADLEVSGLSGFLDSFHLRVNEDMAQCYYEYYGARLDPKYVFADQEKTANVLMTFDNTESPKYTTVPATLNSNFGNTPLGIRVVDSPTVDLIFDITVKNSTGETFAFTDVTLAAGDDSDGYLYGYNPEAGVYGTGFETSSDFFDIFFKTNITAEFPIIIGETTLYSSTVAAGATSIIVNNNNGSSLTGFKANTYAVIVDTTNPDNFDEDDADYNSGIYRLEYIKISSISGNTLTLSTGLKHSYNSTTAKIFPCFTGVTAFALSGSNTNTTDGEFKIVPVSDREPSLS
jgi:hypothetical protein